MASSTVPSTEEPQLTIQSFQQCSSLISIKLTSSNFLLWQSQIVRLIRNLDLYHHIESDDKPAPTIERDGEQAPNPSYKPWLTNDGLLISWLLGTMKEEIMTTTFQSGSAYQLWSTLEANLLPITEAHLKNMLETCHKGTKSMDNYLKEFKYICDSLAAIKQPVSEYDKVFNFAHGLGLSYEPFYRGMLARPCPSFSQFVFAIQEFEQTQAAYKEKAKVMAEDDDYRTDSEDIKLEERWESTITVFGPVKYEFAQPFSISVVPEELRKGDEDAYVPKVVSVGPQFKGANRDLLRMEGIKRGYMQSLLYRTIDAKESSRRCTKAILQFDEAVRSCYVGQINFDKHGLASMMLLDGCFLLELLITESEVWNQRLESRLPGPRVEVRENEEVLTDFILVENQIPLFILQTLFETLFPQVFRDQGNFKIIENLALSLFGSSPDSISWFDSAPKSFAAHFLELVHSSIVLEERQDSSTTDHIINTEVGHRPHVELNRCATRLQAAGITIKPPDSDSDPAPSDTELPLIQRLFSAQWDRRTRGAERQRRHVNDPAAAEVIRSFNFDTKFNSSNGRLEIPPLHITKTTEDKWRNFIAWEHRKMNRMSSYSIASQKCTSSALLFNGLICCADDVQLLKDRKVILDHLNMSNQDLVNFFRSITMGVDRIIVDSSYGKMVDDLSKYSSTPCAIQIPKILWHLRRTPEFIAKLLKFLSRGYNFAAALISLLAIVQTVYAILSYKKC